MKHLYGLIGFPLKHSFSSHFFNDKFNNEGIKAEYRNYEIEDVNDLKEIIFNNPELKGLNVTIPYKESVISLLNELSPIAEDINAVNVIKIRRDVNSIELIGHNTDYIGFLNSFSKLINKRYHKSALVLGTGGASKAICKVLDNLKITWKYVSRHPIPNNYTYDDLTEEIIINNKIIINTTPLGMFPEVNIFPKIIYSALTPQHFLYDLIYNPKETIFLQKGRVKGCTTKNGQEMLYLQALAAWEYWSEEE